MSLRCIGPVLIDRLVHGEPQFSWSADPATNGQRSAQVAGLLPWPAVQQLTEMLDNPERQQTIGAATGILEQLWFDDELLSTYSGWYLLQTCQLSATRENSLQSLAGLVPFTLKCSFLGASREAIVVSSSRQIPNDFGIVGVPIVVDPFANENTDGSGAWLTVDAGGTTLMREYDSTSPMVSMGAGTEPHA